MVIRQGFLDPFGDRGHIPGDVVRQNAQGVDQLGHDKPQKQRQQPEKNQNGQENTEHAPDAQPPFVIFPVEEKENMLFKGFDDDIENIGDKNAEQKGRGRIKKREKDREKCLGVEQAENQKHCKGDNQQNFSGDRFSVFRIGQQFGQFHKNSPFKAEVEPPGRGGRTGKFFFYYAISFGGESQLHEKILQKHSGKGRKKPSPKKTRFPGWVVPRKEETGHSV